jgi:hypothetical protein
MTKEEFSGAVRAILGDIKVSSASKEVLESRMQVLHFAFTLCQKSSFDRGGNHDLNFEKQLPNGVENVYDLSWHYGKSEF